MPTARFEADFSGFISAIDASKIALVNFNTGAQDVEKTLNAMTDQFSGRQVIQEASLMVVAIEKLGGVSTLTAAELQQVGAKADEAAQKLRAMGSDVPEGIQKYADAAKNATESTEGWLTGVDILKEALGAIGVTASMAAVIEWVKSLGEAALQIENLALRLQTTTSEVQKFQDIAEATGVPMTKLTSSIQTLQEKLGKDDDKGLAKAFDDLGLSMEAMKDETPFQIFQQIATALDGVKDATQRAEDARLIFGTGWKQLLPALSVDVKKTTGDVQEMTGATVDFFAKTKVGFDAWWTSFKNAAANTIPELIGLDTGAQELAAAVKAIPPIGDKLPKPEALKPLTTSLADLTQTSKDMTVELTAQQKGWDDWKKAVAAVETQTADWHQTLAGLDGAVVESAEHLLQLGVKVKDVQTYFELSDAAMVALQKDMKEWKPIVDAFQAAADATKTWQQRLAELSPEVIEGAKYYLTLGLSVKDVSLIMQQSVKDIEAVKEGMKEQASGVKALQQVQAEYDDYIKKTTMDTYEYQIQKIQDHAAEQKKAFKGEVEDRITFNNTIDALTTAQVATVTAAGVKAAQATVAAWASAQKQIAATMDAATQKQIEAITARAVAQANAFEGDIAGTKAHIAMVEDMARQETDYLISEADRYSHAWAGVMDQAAADYQHMVGKITPGTLDEQAAMRDAVAQVDTTSLGQMIKMGTTSVDLMNQYQAAIEQAMADRGYSIGGTLTPAAQQAGYSSGGTTVNSTVNVTSPLGTSSQIAAAVSSALADALRRQGSTLPTQ